MRAKVCSELPKSEVKLPFGGEFWRSFEEQKRDIECLLAPRIVSSGAGDLLIDPRCEPLGCPVHHWVPHVSILRREK